MAYFCEIRSADNTVLKRDGGFATQDAAKIAGREDAKKIKNMRQPDMPDVGSAPFPLSPQDAAPPALTDNPPVSTIIVADPHLKLPRTYQWNSPSEKAKVYL